MHADGPLKMEDKGGHTQNSAILDLFYANNCLRKVLYSRKSLFQKVQELNLLQNLQRG